MNSVDQIIRNIDTYLGVGVLLFEIESLTVLHFNEIFKSWFDITENSLLEILPEIDEEKLRKRLSREKEYKREREIKDGHRNRSLKIECTKVSNTLGLVKVFDKTKEKELEFMIDSYAKLVEKNKRKLEAANSRIQAQNDRMLRELEIARQVQFGMLPFDFNPKNDSVEFAALLKPAKEVGGDFFDIFYIDNENLCICLGDVSDKGAGSALFMAATKTLIKSHALNSKSTASIVSRVNNELARNNDKCMFTTLFVGIFHIEDGTLLFSNCGHCFPMLISENMSLSEVKELNGPAVGILEGYSFTEQEVAIKPSQILLVYSDGVTEAKNNLDDLYSENALKRLIRSSATPSNPETLIHTVFDAVDSFEKGTEQSDDITIMALKYKPKGPLH